jgi:hypothetical protein
MMSKSDVLTKVLAITGTVLAAFPILAPIILTLVLFVGEHVFRFDYLMPAELFLSALIGGILLVWAALRAHSRVKHIVWSLGLAVAALALTQGTAVVTGLASGQAEPVGWRWILVLSFLVLFNLMLILLAVGGFFLIRDLYKPQADHQG